ncbi:hypothetical protein F4861DRAFT_313716 [Xylaria intraflava]|nr:hypothetical protein F4861DRAFT_313716 [Xylaria intraflava]
MCVNNIYTDIRPDGHHRTWSEIDVCKNVRAELPCEGLKSLRHPPGYKRTEPRSPITYSHGQLPPTPPLSYHSDHTSDSERSSKRRPSTYAAEPKVIDINRRRSLRHDRQGSKDRVSYMSSSPLSRTPPLHPHGMPASPIPDVYDTYEPTYRDVDKHERPTSSHGHAPVSVEIIDKRAHGHRRQSSSTKTSSSHGSTDDGRRQRRPSEHHDDQYWQRKKESEIARQNEAIANRTPVPQTPQTPRYRRGSVAVASIMPVAERMRLEEERAQRQRKKEVEAQEREIEAQKQRLKDRMSRRPYNYI